MTICIRKYPKTPKRPIASDAVHLKVFAFAFATCLFLENKDAKGVVIDFGRTQVLRHCSMVGYTLQQMHNCLENACDQETMHPVMYELRNWENILGQAPAVE